MGLQKELFLRQGAVSMSVFRGDMDGRILVALDKEYTDRRIKGPLFSERDIYDLVEMIRDYDEWESKAMHGKPNRLLKDEDPRPDATAVLEVGQAIAVARAIPPKKGDDGGERRAAITVIPSLPAFSYSHTCSRCGCHIESRLVIAPGVGVSICPGCERANALHN